MNNEEIYKELFKLMSDKNMMLLSHLYTTFILLTSIIENTTIYVTNKKLIQIRYENILPWKSQIIKIENLKIEILFDCIDYWLIPLINLLHPTHIPNGRNLL